MPSLLTRNIRDGWTETDLIQAASDENVTIDNCIEQIYSQSLSPERGIRKKKMGLLVAAVRENKLSVYENRRTVFKNILTAILRLFRVNRYVVLQGSPVLYDQAMGIDWFEEYLSGFRSFILTEIRQLVDATNQMCEFTKESIDGFDEYQVRLDIDDPRELIEVEESLKNAGSAIMQWSAWFLELVLWSSDVLLSYVTPLLRLCVESFYVATAPTINHRSGGYIGISQPWRLSEMRDQAMDVFIGKKNHSRVRIFIETRLHPSLNKTVEKFLTLVLRNAVDVRQSTVDALNACVRVLGYRISLVDEALEDEIIKFIKMVREPTWPAKVRNVLRNGTLGLSSLYQFIYWYLPPDEPLKAVQLLYELDFFPQSILGLMILNFMLPVSSRSIIPKYVDPSIAISDGLINIQEIDTILFTSPEIGGDKLRGRLFYLNTWSAVLPDNPVLPSEVLKDEGLELYRKIMFEHAVDWQPWSRLVNFAQYHACLTYHPSDGPRARFYVQADRKVVYEARPSEAGKDISLVDTYTDLFIPLPKSIRLDQYHTQYMLTHTFRHCDPEQFYLSMMHKFPSGDVNETLLPPSFQVDLERLLDEVAMVSFKTSEPNQTQTDLDADEDFFAKLHLLGLLGLSTAPIAAVVDRIRTITLPSRILVVELKYGYLRNAVRWIEENPKTAPSRLYLRLVKVLGVFYLVHNMNGIPQIVINQLEQSTEAIANVDQSKPNGIWSLVTLITNKWFVGFIRPTTRYTYRSHHYQSTHVRKMLPIYIERLRKHLGSANRPWESTLVEVIWWITCVQDFLFPLQQKRHVATGILELTPAAKAQYRSLLSS